MDFFFSFKHFAWDFFFYFLNLRMASFHQFRRILSHYLSEYCLFPILSTYSFHSSNEVFASFHSVIQVPLSHTLSNVF